MENFNEYHKIKRFGDEENKDIFSDSNDVIIVEEKIDGANFRFAILNGNIVFGSRTQQITSDLGVDSNIDKNFRRCVDFIRETLRDKDLSKYEGLIFYGEDCVKHTLSYDWDKIPPFLGFDIYRIVDGVYLDYEMVFEIYGKLGLPIVPLVGRYYAHELVGKIDDSFVPVSEYAPKSNPKQQAEGVVCKNYKKQIFAKYVRNEFKEQNHKVFGGNPKYNKQGETNNDELVFKFCTNARIEKNIFKLIDEGNKLEMALMKYLVTRVYEDIMEEEWRTICFSKWNIDFKTLKKLMTHRCKAVLDQVIVNNSL